MNIYKDILEILSIAQYEYLSHKDVRSVYQDILLFINKAFSADISFIAALDDKLRNPKIISISSSSDQKEPYWFALPNEQDLVWNAEILTSVIEKEQLLTGEMSSFIEQSYFRRQLNKGYFTIFPILHGTRVHGFLAALRKKKGFEQEETSCLASMLFFLGNMMHARENEKEKVRLFEELKAQKTLLEKFIYSMPVAVTVLDQDLNYLHSSYPWIGYFKSTTHKSLLETLKDKSYHGIIELVQEIQKNHKYLKKDIEVKTGKNKKFFTFSATTWFSSSGAPGGVIMFCEDVTVERQLREQLEKTILQLKDTNEQLDYFATICAHDLREPLRTISSNAQLLGFHEISDWEKTKIREKISESCKNMAHMIQSVLRYSKFKHIAPLIQPIKLKDLIEDLKKELTSILQEKKAMIQVQSLPEPFNADPLQMKQLFSNLIVNSLKYNTSDFPRVSITQIDKPDMWLFQIEDNGIGFEKQYQKLVQDIFKNKIKSPSGLRGLGLMIVQRVVKNHGGVASLTRSSQKGSIFTIKIPKVLEKHKKQG
jgi:nitrogen fixation/metabolism regulation signal transduction histidine kinase